MAPAPPQGAQPSLQWALNILEAKTVRPAGRRPEQVRVVPSHGPGGLVPEIVIARSDVEHTLPVAPRAHLRERDLTWA